MVTPGQWLICATQRLWWTRTIRAAARNLERQAGRRPVESTKSSLPAQHACAHKADGTMAPWTPGRQHALYCREHRGRRRPMDVPSHEAAKALLPRPALGAAVLGCAHGVGMVRLQTHAGGRQSGSEGEGREA